MGFMGYPRPDGACGVRNHVAVISTVVCANGVVEAIARAVPGVKAIVHTEGCGRGPKDIAISIRTLIGLGQNPNIAAVLLVGLGCEFIKPEYLQPAIAQSKKPVEALSIQQEGGSVKTAKKGIEIAKRLVDYATGIAREECKWSTLTLALKCGGSDALSGVTANPTVGVAADWLAGEGGTVLLAETTEMIGTEALLAKRAADAEVARKIVELIRHQHQRAIEELGPMADYVISPGNMDGGLSSIQEKSLGCIIKGGTGAINQVIEYGEKPAKHGLVIMDTPGADVFSLTALAAGGAQISIFTTGRGTPAGFPIMPVIKVSSNTELYNRMGDDIDLNAGVILEGANLAQTGKSLIALVQQVANGVQTKAEINLNDLLAIHTVGPAF